MPFQDNYFPINIRKSDNAIVKFGIKTYKAKLIINLVFYSKEEKLRK